MLGNDKASILFNLIDKSDYCYVNGSLQKGNKFYFTQEEMECKTRVSKPRQSRMVKELNEMGLVSFCTNSTGSKRLKLFYFTQSNIANIKQLIKEGNEILNPRNRLCDNDCNAEDEYAILFE